MLKAKKMLSLVLVVIFGLLQVTMVNVSAAYSGLIAYSNFNADPYPTDAVSSFPKPAPLVNVTASTLNAGVSASRVVAAFGKSATDASLRAYVGSTSTQNVEFQATIDQSSRIINSGDSFTLTTNMATTVFGGVYSATDKGILYKFNNAWVGNGGGYVCLNTDGYIYFFGTKTVQYNLSKWYNIAVTIKGGTKKFDGYVNGVKVITDGTCTSGAEGVNNVTSISLIRYSLKSRTNTVTDLYMDDLEVYDGAYKQATSINVTSSILTKNNTMFLYAPNITVQQFLDSLTYPYAGASASVFQGDGITPVTSGYIQKGYTLRVTSADTNYNYLYNIDSLPPVFQTSFGNSITINNKPTDFTTFASYAALNPLAPVSGTTYDAYNMVGTYGVAGKNSTDQSLRYATNTLTSPTNYIYLDKTISASLATPLTLEYNVNTQGLTSSEVNIKTNSDWTQSVLVSIGSKVVFKTATTIQEFSSSSVDLKKWNRVAIAFTPNGSSTIVKLYINGILLGQGTISPTALTTSLLRFGATPASATQTYADYDDIILYSSGYDSNSYNINIGTTYANVNSTSKRLTLTATPTVAELLSSLVTSATRAEMYNNDFSQKIAHSENAASASWLVLENGDIINYYKVQYGFDIGSIKTFNNDLEITNLVTGNIDARVDVANFVADNFSGVLVLALYDGIMLQKVAVTDATVQQNQAQTIQVTLPVDSINGNSKIRAMFFDSLSNIKPLVNSSERVPSID